jgi:hypothetical protein
MAIIKLESNKPHQIILKYKGGIEKPGRYGLQYLYTLESGDVIYLPPVAHAEIQSLHLEAGEPFMLLKSEESSKVTWTVERIPIPQPGPKLVKKSKAVSKPVTDGHKRYYLDRSNALVEVFADAYEVALVKYKGRVSKDDVRALVTTVFIQLTPRPQANGTRG